MKMTKSLSKRLHDLLKSEFTHSSKNLRKFALSRKYSVAKEWHRVYKDINDDIYIGFINDNGLFCGAKLIRVACGNFDTFCHGIDTPKDVTVWFMSEYENKGMCAYAEGWNHVWSEFCEDGDDKRICIHCDKIETRMVKMIPKVWWE